MAIAHASRTFAMNILKVVPAVRILLVLLSFLSSTVIAGNLKVNLAPTQAVSAGAQWRVDGGVWRASGTTVKNLSNAAHPVEFKSVAGWIAPASVLVTLSGNTTTTVTGTYVVPSAIAVTLTPAGGQWRLDDGGWQNSDTTVTNLAPGAHTLSYTVLSNYLAPASESVTLVAGQTTSLSRSYTATSSLVVSLTPASATWKVDGGAWQASGATVSGLTPGSHAISYSSAVNHLTPATETVTLPAAQTTSLSRSYTASSSLTLNLTPASSWRVDGGFWQSSGATLTGLTPGNHTITYSGGFGYLTPAPEQVSLAAGETTTLSRSLTPAGEIFMMLTQSAGQWRVDGGAWRATHTSSGPIAAGAHLLELAPVAGYLTPGAETVTVTGGQTLSLSKAYTV
jgi:hypothetical protein